MSEKISLNMPKEIWNRYEQLAKTRQEEPLALMEKVLTTYVENEEIDDGPACSVNWLGLGTIEPC